MTLVQWRKILREHKLSVRINRYSWGKHAVYCYAGKPVPTIFFGQVSEVSKVLRSLVDQYSESLTVLKETDEIFGLFYHKAG